MARHNKKRNTGLLYEFLVQTVSNSIIEGDEKNKKIALGIIKEHFASGTELNKEFRLFHSLVMTTTSTPSVADSILEAAKNASNRLDESKLDYEKSLLIRSINHKINDDSFYDKRISEYKIYATIQTLMNEWRCKENNNIVALAEFEQQLKEWLLKSKTKPILEKKSNEFADPLVEKLMLEKINEKYKNNLSEEQSEIIKDYIFSKDDSNLCKKLESIKENIVKNINHYILENNGKDKYLENKLTKAKELILEESVDEITDNKIERFLDISKLNQELKG